MRRCYPVCVADLRSPVPPAPPPPPPENEAPKPRLRRLWRGLLIFLGVIVVIVGVFEVWRQGTLKSERDALAETIQQVDDTILRGKTPVEHYNAQVNVMRSKCPCIVMVVTMR